MRKTILIVDDSKFNRDIIRKQLEELSGFHLEEKENGQEALEFIEAHEEDIAAVTLDVVMPVMDGVTLLKHLNEKALMKNFPVVVVTSEQPGDIVEACFDYGITDFIRKPIREDIMLKRIRKHMELYLQRNEFREMVERQTKTVRNQYALLQKQAQRYERLTDNVISMLGTVVEFRGLGNSLHIQNVRAYSRILANRLAQDYPEYGIDKEMVERIVSASGLHDIGKAFIPEAILLKPGKLTDDEYELVKSHTLRGCEVLEQLDFDWDPDFFQICYDICRSHHERYDGTGYPDHTKGDGIPIAAQIVAVADTYDVLTTERVYKRAFSPDMAFQVIISGDQGMFPPKIMESFRKARGEMELYLEECKKKEE